MVTDDVGRERVLKTSREQFMRRRGRGILGKHLRRPLPPPRQNVFYTLEQTHLDARKINYVLSYVQVCQHFLLLNEEEKSP